MSERFSFRFEGPTPLNPHKRRASPSVSGVVATSNAVSFASLGSFGIGCSKSRTVGVAHYPVREWGSMAIGAMEWADCGSKLEEYWTHVASQEEMPLAGVAAIPSDLKLIEARYPSASSYVPGQISNFHIAEWLLEDRFVAKEFRMLSSLSDKRFYLDLSYKFSREHIVQGTAETICGCFPHEMKKHSTDALLNMFATGSYARKQRAAEVAADYLVSKGLLTVLDLYLPLDRNARWAVREKWLYPKEAQQNETKRRGHGAEGEVARVLVEAGVDVIPENKATNPMGAHDPNVRRKTFVLEPRRPRETFSADLAVLGNDQKLQLVMMGLVQSSDPGQFGVDKADTNRSIRQELDEFRTSTGSTLEMWGLVDGVGYSENVNGTVAPMLEHFDHFIQHKSAYKAVLGAHRLGLCRVVGIRYDSTFYSDKTAKQMHDKYGGEIEVLGDDDEGPLNARPIEAGKAIVWVDNYNEWL